MILFYIGYAILFVILTWHFLTKKYLNPYKLIFIFGKKGSGKSTLLAKYATKYRSRGWQVYSTEPILGTQRITYADIGFKTFPPESLIIIDEVGMIWDNRNFKGFAPEVRDFFKLQRHDHLAVVMASQTFDVDKKIRDLCDQMYLVKPFLRVWTIGRRILRVPCLIEAKDARDGGSRIDENLKFDSLLMFWAGSIFFTFIPHWAKYFDSFAKRDWGPPVPAEYVHVPDALYKKERWHKRYRRAARRADRRRRGWQNPFVLFTWVFFRGIMDALRQKGGRLSLHLQVNKIKRFFAKFRHKKGGRL